MPITPLFTLSQTSTHILLTLTLPYIRVGDAETLIEGKRLSFSCKSYLLKLNFDDELKDTPENPVTAIYDPNVSNGTLKISIPKSVPNTNFKDLDLTTKLLQPKIPKVYRPKIEVIDPNDLSGTDSDDEVFESEVSVLDHLENIEEQERSETKYGFNLGFSNEFRKLREELREISSVDLDLVGWSEKRRIRLALEKSDFDKNRYQSDYFLNTPNFLPHNPEGPDMLFTSSMSYIPFYLDITSQLTSLKLSPTDSTTLTKIPNTPQKVTSTYPLNLGLISLLFSYIYDLRLTAGEPNVESAWNVWKLSAVMCYFESYHSERDGVRGVLEDCCRRAVCYGYCRSWELCEKVVEDLIVVVKDRRFVLKCLIEMRGIFERSETLYLMNKFYLEGYLVWVQGEEEWGEFGGEVEEVWRGLGRDFGRFRGGLGLGLREAEEEVDKSIEDVEEEDENEEDEGDEGDEGED
ncbi:hypothetical protein TrVE_jg5805 [Triparma verrucosa]|uniref:CS domain-containing protein n=1 Tax=Triparma verrucosa TaxID=1606542 RepID=A0A9W7FBS3_9STRA|nr:hypothetical protein TrVE_jg5805 [Triparma verrucosa]